MQTEICVVSCATDDATLEDFSPNYRPSKVCRMFIAIHSSCLLT